MLSERTRKEQRLCMDPNYKDYVACELQRRANTYWLNHSSLYYRSVYQWTITKILDDVRASERPPYIVISGWNRLFEKWSGDNAVFGLAHDVSDWMEEELFDGIKQRKEIR